MGILCMKVCGVLWSCGEWTLSLSHTVAACQIDMWCMEPELSFSLSHTVAACQMCGALN